MSSCVWHSRLARRSSTSDRFAWNARITPTRSSLLARADGRLPPRLRVQSARRRAPSRPASSLAEHCSGRDRARSYREGHSVIAKYRSSLPQLSGRMFLTDGGMETTLIFREGVTLPDFAAFDLLKTEEGAAMLRRYFRIYSALAQRFGTGLIVESATWRANRDWGRRLGYTRETLAESNTRAIAVLQDIRRDFESDDRPVVISGCIGPRGDGYVPDSKMSAEEA